MGFTEYAYRKFYNLIIKKIFMKPWYLIRSWNNGILEGWVIEGWYPIINLPFNPRRTNKTIFHFARTHDSIIPGGANTYTQ
jgi:hypothetical protein